MRLVDLLLPEFDHEMASTRRVLERAPESLFGWRPHETSWTMGGICTHLAHIPRWGVSILKHNSYDLAQDAGARPLEKTSAADVVMMSLPRMQAFKSFAISHVVHHRGQLTVYLRLQNVAVPPLYGPTDDEGA